MKLHLNGSDTAANTNGIRLAVSGTYSSGKTTTTLALSYLTGMPRTHAKTMREILPTALPGKRLEDCTPPELFQLGLRRYVERAVHESHLPKGFISDGSSLHEWVYGKARMIVGINPNDSAPVLAVKRLWMLPVKHIYEQVNENIGQVVKQHAKQAYDEFIHLPVEFPLVADGHRPVSERFRNLSDELLISTLEELKIKYHVVGGDIRARLETILAIYNLRPVMDMNAAISRATEEVRQMHHEIEAYAETVASQKQGEGMLKRLAARARKSRHQPHAASSSSRI